MKVSAALEPTRHGAGAAGAEESQQEQAGLGGDSRPRPGQQRRARSEGGEGHLPRHRVRGGAAEG